MDSIITVDNVSMHFRMDKNHTTSLKEWVVSFLKGKQQYEEFHALENVTFDVKRGEIFGVIGRNGAGKSTLLKVVSGIYKPTSGKAVSAGRIAPMLELGSGFDQELSGHDNIFLNGAILGFSEDFLKQKYDEIVAFSELGEFIHQPIKTYSSGMMMRLAFSVATIVEPEILIVDEILAVGDASFQQKSRARMLELMQG
ncbi:MAG: ABC transporter ATP-binding protein, partial [Aristaeellaceae bacterium]